MKPTKCNFLYFDLPFLGHRISKDGLRKDPAKLARLKDWPTPTTVNTLQQFLGFANYFKRFIKDYSNIASPLYKLLHKDRSFDWTAECDSAFRKLVAVLSEDNLLSTPSDTDNLIIECDASGVALGAALYIKGPDNLRSSRRPVAFASRTLSDVEIKTLL